MARYGAEAIVEPRCGMPRVGQTSRSQLFLNGLRTASRVVFVSHVHPDPDALGSMLGLSHLVETILDKPTILTRDGPISRAENRVMTDVLHLELTPIEAVDWSKNDAVVMVDSQPNTGRHTFCKTVPVHSVIDHHETPGDLSGLTYCDIRPDLGATCTIVTEYLREQGVRPSEKVATALLYGLETESSGWPRESSEADDEAFVYLYPMGDKDLLAYIRNARRPQSHFSALFSALKDATIYDKLILSWIEPLPQPEQAAEVVDFLIRHDKSTWALCAGVHGGKVILSLRAAHSHARAGELLREVVGDMGAAGGHDRRAGGCIPLRDASPAGIEWVKTELRSRLQRVLKLQDVEPRKLITE